MAHAPGRVVLAAVAGAEPAAPVAARIGRLVAERHAAEMGADADQDDPLVVAGLHPRRVRLRLDQLRQRHVLGFLDLGRRAVADEDRLALPEHGDALALDDRRQVHLDRRQRQHVLRGVHGVDQRPGDGGGADRRAATGDQFQEIALGDVAGVAVVGDGGGGRVSHLSLESVRFRPGRRTRLTAGQPAACPEFRLATRRVAPVVARRSLRDVPRLLQHVAQHGLSRLSRQEQAPDDRKSAAARCTAPHQRSNQPRGRGSSGCAIGSAPRSRRSRMPSDGRSAIARRPLRSAPPGSGRPRTDRMAVAGS